MMNDIVGIFLGSAATREWFRRSLILGQALSADMIDRLPDVVEGTLFVPEEYRSLASELSETAQGMALSISRQLAEREVGLMVDRGIRCIVVEDDLGRRGDRGVDREAAYVGDALLRWRKLSANDLEGINLLTRGSSGYPLNAFFLDKDPEELGLQIDRDVTRKQIEQIVRSTRVLMTSAFDGEAFVGANLRDASSGPRTLV